jgi:hemerythrin superfamily protein
MADVTELLTQDHRKVEQLFQQYQQSKDQSTLRQICQELQVHTQVEEEIVYPRLAQIDRPLEQHAEDEHRQAKQLIEQIQSNGSDAGAAEQLARQLEAAVKEHVQEEESKAFPELRQQAADQLDEMGRRVEERKQALKQSATR